MPLLSTRGAASAKAFGFTSVIPAPPATPKRFAIFMGSLSYNNTEAGYLNQNLLWANTQLNGAAGSTFDIFYGGDGSLTAWSGNTYTFNSTLSNHDVLYWGNGSGTNTTVRSAAWTAFSAGKGVGQMMFITSNYQENIIYESGVPSGYRISSGVDYTIPGNKLSDLSSVNQPFCKNIGTIQISNAAYVPVNLQPSGAGVGYGLAFTTSRFNFVVANQAGLGRRWDSSYGTYLDSGWNNQNAFNDPEYANVLKQTVQALYWLAQSPLL